MKYIVSEFVLLSQERIRCIQPVPLLSGRQADRGIGPEIRFFYHPVRAVLEGEAVLNVSFIVIVGGSVIRNAVVPACGHVDRKHYQQEEKNRQGTTTLRRATFMGNSHTFWRAFWDLHPV